MEYVLVTNHEVEDYARWKEEFDRVLDIRRAGGEKGYQIFYIKGQPNKLVALFKWDNLENAHKYFQSKELQAAMKRAGVTGQLEVQFLESIEQGTT
jgi:quinol monooxygenase YgiN